MEHKVSDRRIIIYPPYLNSKLKVREGRRIPVELACENPSCHEVFESVLRLNFKAQLEVKKMFCCLSHMISIQMSIIMARKRQYAAKMASTG